MTKRRLMIIGAGGHGKVVADCAEAMGSYQDIAFLDDRYGDIASLEHWPVVGKPREFATWQENTDYFVAIGHNQTRASWLDALMKAKVSIATLIHPSSTVSVHSTIGQGSLVCAGALINPFTSVGIGCILNSACQVDHDCFIGDYVHLAPSVALAGTVNIANMCFLGIGTIVIQGISICTSVQTGAGTVVVKDLAQSGLWLGTPARQCKP